MNKVHGNLQCSLIAKLNKTNGNNVSLHCVLQTAVFENLSWWIFTTGTLFFFEKTWRRVRKISVAFSSRKLPEVDS